MASSKNANKATVVAHATQLIVGVTKQLGSSTQVPLLGSSYTPAELTTKLQQVVSIQSDVDATKALVKTKLSAQETSMTSLRPLMGALVTYAKAAFGSQPDPLADFGIHPKARTPLTVKAKAAATTMRAATRGTMGAVQKKAVKGAVTGVTITPTTAPQPVAPVATSRPTAGAPSPAPTAGWAPHAAT